MTIQNCSINLSNKLKKLEEERNKSFEEFMSKRKSLVPFISKIEDDGLFSLTSMISYTLLLLLYFCAIILSWDYFLKGQGWISFLTLMLSFFVFAFYPGKIQTKVMNYIYSEKENTKRLKKEFLLKEQLDKEILSIIKKDFGEKFLIKMFKINNSPNYEDFIKTLKLEKDEQKIIAKVIEI